MASAAETFAAIGSGSPPSPPGRPARLGRAAVLGGSLAGLLAARVLAEHPAAPARPGVLWRSFRARCRPLPERTAPLEP